MLISIAFGLAMATPAGVLTGIALLVGSPDILVTDYIYIAGLSAAVVNAALVGLSGVGICLACGHKPRGLSIAALWLLFGFAFFGKNILNIWPIIIGGLLYSRFVKIPFRDNVLITLFATALSPAVSNSLWFGLDKPYIVLAYSTMMGVLIGFVIGPLAKATIKAHDGFNLYNVGFAAGILAIVINSAHQSFGVYFELSTYWSSGKDAELSLLIATLSFVLIAVGLALRGASGLWASLRALWKAPKESLDFYANHGDTAYINMGIMGLISLLVASIAGVGLSGPIAGAIFSVMGFGASGKHPLNAGPIMLGGAIAAVTSTLGITPGIVVNILFGTCLSPITSSFGKLWGITAGFVHMHLVTSLAITHGGMNLYNNGASAGFVATILVAIIRSIHEAKANRQKGIAQ